MQIGFIKPIQFGYRSILKTEWLKGNMPSVTHDMAGNLLTKENITNGHMLPHSKKGATALHNLMLETKEYNLLKGNKPFSSFFDFDGFKAYCEQFKDIKLENFDGMEYITSIAKTALKLLKEGK